MKGWGHWFLSRNIFSQRTQQLSRGNFSSQVFIYTYNFGCRNLKCSWHKPLNLSQGFYSPGLAVLTLFRCCLQHLSLAFARCVSGFVDSIFEYTCIYLNIFEYMERHQKTSKDMARTHGSLCLSLCFFRAIAHGFAEMSGCV